MEQLERHFTRKHAPKIHTCGQPKCGSFADLRSLRRHLKTAKIHQSGSTSFYTCACGSRASRKDHHSRHVRAAKCTPIGSFRCWCGRESHQLQDHQVHFRDCLAPGSRRRGRPPNRNTGSGKG